MQIKTKNGGRLAAALRPSEISNLQFVMRSLRFVSATFAQWATASTAARSSQEDLPAGSSAPAVTNSSKCP